MQNADEPNISDTDEIDVGKSKDSRGKRGERITKTSQR